MPKVSKTASLQYLCNISRKTWKEIDFFASRWTSKFPSNWYYHFRYMWLDIMKLPKITRLVFLSISWIRSEWWSWFLHADNYVNLIQIHAMVLMGMAKHYQSSQNSKFAMFLQYLKKKFEMKLIFCMQIHIKVSYKLISTLWASKFPAR